MSNNTGSNPPSRKPLDLTSRLYANSLHTGALTEKGPVLPWVPTSSISNLGATSATNVVHATNETNIHHTLHGTTTNNNATNTIFSATDKQNPLATTSTIDITKLSKAAREILETGKKKVGYIHERYHGSSADEAKDSKDNTEDALTLSQQLPNDPYAMLTTTHGTFIESLNLSSEALEDLATGNFVYLRQRSGMWSNVYNLQLCHHSETNPQDYYTLSSSGVTHFSGVSNSEFVSLAQFEREYRLFNAIMRIPFFRKYRVWKAYTGWKKGISSTKQNDASNKLSSGLFLLNNTLRGTLMQLRKLCAEISDYGLFDVDKTKTYSIENFVSAQNDKRVRVTAWLTEFSISVRALVRSACDQVLEKFLADNNIQSNLKMTFMERASLRNACRRLTKFIRLCDYLVRDTLMNLALDSTVALQDIIHPPPEKLPPRTIRTELPAEGLDAEALAAAAAAEAAAQAAAARKKGQKLTEAPAVPLFKVQVSFEQASVGGAPQKVGRRSSIAGRRRSVDLSARRASNAEEKKGEEEEKKEEPPVPTGPEAVMVLTPSINVVKTAMRGVLYDAMVVISAPPRLLSHPDLAPYTAAADDDSLDNTASSANDIDLTEVVTSAEAYRKCSNDIFNGLDSAFENVDNFCTVFMPYGRTFLRNEANLGGMSGDGYSGPMELSAFEAAIALYKGQIAEFDEVPTAADIGIVQVDSIELKKRLIPSPTRCLQAIRDLLPRLMTKLTSALVDEVRNMYNVVASSPSEVEPFVAKVEMLEKSQEALPAFRDRENYIRSIAQLMAENQWGIEDDLKAQFRMLKDALIDLESSAEKATASLEEDTKKFARQVEQSIPVLKKAVQGVREAMDNPIFASADSPPAKMVQKIREQATKMEELKALGAKYQHYQTMLKQNVTEFDVIDETHADLQTKLKLWEAFNEFQAQTQAWKEAPFSTIDAEELGKQVQSYLKVAARSEKLLPGNTAAPKLKGMVEDFKGLLPVVQDLRNKALKPRHWSDIMAAIGHEIDITKDYRLGELLGMNVVEHQAEITVISTKAVQESALEDLFAKKVSSIWTGMEFTLNSYKESKEVFVLAGVDEVIAALDESLVNLNTILGSRYCAPIRGDVESYQKKLMLLSETLDEWMTCQKQWMYLETIFSAEDIKRQLPEESKRFLAVDRSWKQIMKRTYNNPNCIVAGTVKGLKETLVRHNEVLEAIQKSLEEYLETKRGAFPRFYFLSNEELLEILAQTRDPQAVQPHLRKCFDALVQLEFGKEPGSIDILAMISPEKERVELTKNLKARGNVEDWLMEVQRAMITSLNRVLKEGVIDYARRPRKEWVLSHAAQVVATGAQIMWSKGTEDALRDANPITAMSRWYDQNVSQLQDLTALVRSKLTRLERATIVALVTTDVHARDIVEGLRDDKVDTIGNFLWQQQLRYYWEESKQDCIVRQANAAIGYGYEYQGATTRLVITPLTDRCWMTITGAYNLKLGAAPAGPAGTGKTESSKDLAKALGIQCIVFNCSDQIDYMMMGKLFAGLAQSGAWTCLDEFNRIDIEVLSVVAQQIQQLRQGILQGLSEMPFEGRHIKLKPHSVIITMNPGYAGRTELPDNLKVQFRPVSMMVPDYALIAEIILFSEGFDDSKNLSRKMTKLYKLSSEQLSQQRHYDFGMRAVKSVLVMAGSLKRAFPDLGEDVVLIRAMRDSNVPKFLADDLPLFHAIVGDLFPGVTVPHNDTGELQATILKEIGKAGLQVVPCFTDKVLQLFETFNVRFGAVLVGPTMAGKTAAYQVLANAMTTLREMGSKNDVFQKVTFSVLNPKCITMGELYGEFNEMTQEWRDGLASTIIRGFVADETDDKKWTVWDGPIDALWIENMNTVLDDNMTLCLANGERIKLKVAMRMLFEVGDLDAASPATVSRLGVVFMTPTDLGWQPFVKSWIPREMPAKMPEALREYILNLFLTTVDIGLQFRKANCIEPIVTTDIQTVATLCRLFTALIRTAGEKNKETGAAPGLNMERPIEDLKKIIDSLFAFSYVWSIGGTITSEGYEKFDNLLKAGALKTTGLGAVRWGPGTVYDCFPDIANPEVPFRKWSDIVPSFTYDRELPYFAMVVPTIDTVRFNYLLETNLSQLYPVFFTGVTGTGKTVIIQDFLNKASSAEYRNGVPVQPIVVNFSAQTSSLDTQMTIEGKLEKKKKTQLGAPTGKRIVLFVDDVNMPSMEVYGAQPPIELLRQYVDHKGFYDRNKLFWKDITDTVIVSAAAPPGGGRAVITTRFSRHFHMLCIPPASEDVLQHIFGSIFGGFASIFPDEIKGATKKLVSATIEVFRRVREAMKPTPAKSHYTFNLRDVSKVFQGMLMVGPKEVNNGDVLTRLWAHECCRVFHDRLIDVEDKKVFTTIVQELVARYMGKTGSGWSHADLFENRSILFVDFLRPNVDDGPGIYEEASDINKVVAVLDDQLDEYNLSNPTQMKLVFFRDAVEHVTRIKRILRQPRGNAMLVGVGGSGKQSLTRMACHMSGVEIFTIELVRGYGINEFREDIKKIMFKSGVAGKPIAFLFGDTQIVQEGFLEDISNVLNTGEVPGLFANDEVTKIVEDLRPVAVNMGIPDTRDNVYRLFVSRVRDNLHIILTMSPVGSALRVRCRQFPSLINCCTIDWYTPWPRDALMSVATRFLEHEDLGSPETKAAICELCVEVHMTVGQFSDRFFAELQRKVYTTPKSYLDLINLYLTMLAEKRNQLGDLRNTLAVGSQKLDETNSIVVNLKGELTKLQPIIDIKSKEAAELLVKVSADKIEADKIKAVVEKDAAEVSVQAAEVRVVQEDAQKDLDVALPALKAAEDALAKLDKKDITEVKSFAKPPKAVQTVMEAVCILLGEKPDWDTAKIVLSRGTFMEELINYDRENVPPAYIQKVKKYVENPEMAVEAVARVSKAATTLAQWVHAVDIYARVAKEVEPKKARLAEMNAKLDSANKVLKEKQDALQVVLDKVAALQKMADDAEAEKARLAHEAQLTKDRLERAGKLTTGLADEGVRWKASVERYDVQINNLIGDVLLSAACISYYGAFTGVYRAEMVNYWLTTCRGRKIPVSDDYSLQQTMGDPVLVRDWQINGLPTDAVSTDNAILVTRGKRWPLLIDPQEQAKKWIKNMEARAKLAVTRLSNPNMLRTLESCIRIGQPLLIEDIGEYLDPALEPVLQRAVFKQGGRLLIHLGDSDIDYDPTFKLYMTTKLPNPHYLPEVCIKVTIINFTVTMSGLVDQLLGAVVKKERPDVEKKKNDLVVSMAKDKKQLKDLEDKILKLLRESKGNILDDKVLIETLAESKELSKVIAERLRESEKTEAEINEMRERYRPVSVRGSLIYFVIADLALCDPMYQFSLAYFTSLYNRCIDLAEKSNDLDKRLQTLMTYLTAAAYSNICRGLFETHKLIFSFLMCVQIMREAGLIADAEWSLLLRGGGMVVNKDPNPMADILSETGWNFIAALEKNMPDKFTGLAHHIANPSNLHRWREWAEHADPHTQKLPEPWSEQLNQMQFMLVLKAFREEKGVFAVKDFVAANLGRSFVESPPVQLAEVMKDTREDVPLIFILSTGADPTNQLFAYAKTQNYMSRLKLISLGQGQGPRAQQLIETACSTGDWVLLQNCHLAKSWMPNLEKIVDTLAERRAGTSDAGPINQDFRLFLTSMPAPYFPVPVLQNGVKLTNEPPKGIRANLNRSFAQLDTWTPFENCDGNFSDGMMKIHAWKKLAFGLCFFHAVLQERRKFGPLGFNVAYEFNDSDLETSIAVLKMFLVEQPDIPWDALRYVTGQINYGGRVTDDWDRRCLMAILGRYYSTAILGDDYKFSPSGTYYAPPVGALDVYKDYAQGLPLNDNPEIFGLHMNANIASQRRETGVLLDTVLSLQPRSGGSSGGRSPDEIVGELATEMETELPAKLSMEEAGAGTFVMKGEHMDSLATVLSQEMERFNKLLKVMAGSLFDLQRAIRGEVLLSEELDKMYTAILNNKVPGNWEAAAYPSLKPLASWVKDLHLRIAFMRKWLIGGQPSAYWLSGFFFPQGFMTGTLQNHARKYAIAIDTLNFSFRMLDADGPDDLNPKDVPEDGIVIYGLFFDGARWDKQNKTVADSRPGEIFATVPCIHFMPTKDYKPSPKEYSAPVYKTSVRAGTLSTTGMSTNFIVTVEMPTTIDPSNWILKGAALLSQLND